jgi:membrane-bound lytic murein transglycosylase B
MRKLMMVLIIIGLSINGSHVNAVGNNEQVKEATNLKNLVIEKLNTNNDISAQKVVVIEKTTFNSIKDQVLVSKNEIEESVTTENALRNAGLKTEYAALYLKVSKHSGVPWQILAAVHRVETRQSGTTMITSYAGAQGPMQFMPATFRAYGVDGNGDGIVDIGNIDDAMFSAANYLKANGAARGEVYNALYRYNRSHAYVNHVLGIAHSLGY